MAVEHGKKKGLPHSHLARACCGSWEAMPAFESEMGYVADHENGKASLSFVLWRHSNILLLVLCFFVAMILVSTSLVLSLDQPRQDRDEAEKSMKRIFETVYNTELAIVIIKLVVLVVSWLLMCVALFKWKNRDVPNKLLRICWLMTFSLPFLLQLVPYRRLVDIADAFAKEGVTKDVVTALCVSAKASDEGYRCAELVSLEDSDCPKNCNDLYDLILVNIETVVGAGYGVRSLITLAPVVISLFPGIQKGALIVKAALPWHPLPGFLAMSKPILFVPLMYTLDRL